MCNLYDVLVQRDVIFHHVKWKLRQQFWRHTTSTFHNGNKVCDLLMVDKQADLKKAYNFDIACWYWEILASFLII